MGESKRNEKQRGRRKGRVLVIEDEALIALETCNHLEDWGYEVCGVAANCREAVRAADHERPQIAIVDVNLRGGDDGVAVARLLRERWGALVIFLTGSNDARSRRRMQAFRPAACVFKPYLPSELRSALAGVVA